MKKHYIVTKIKGTNQTQLIDTTRKSEALAVANRAKPGKQGYVTVVRITDAGAVHLDLDGRVMMDTY